MNKQLKPIPKLANEAEEQAFLGTTRLRRLPRLDEGPAGCVA